VDPERRTGIDDRPDGAEQPLFVVPGRLRRAGHQHDPAPVLVDEGFEEADAVLVGGRLDHEHELLHRSGERFRSLRLEQRIGAAEPDHADRRVAVLRLDRARRERRPQRGR
jgi:hypothetical protein